MGAWDEKSTESRREVRRHRPAPMLLVPADASPIERAAIAFALGLAVARAVVGLVETVFPRSFLRVLGKLGTATPGAALGFRMKGGRDLAVGVATLGAAIAGDRGSVAQLTATGVIIDAVDGLAVAREGRGTLRRPVSPYGAYAGYAVAVAAGLAAWVLGRDD